MGSRTTAASNIDLHKIQQAIKWTVYTLLIINFVYYIHEDWSRAVHTLRAGATFLDWIGEFATSIDETGWFVLLFMFELETYVVEDENWTGWLARTVRVVRLICYAMIAHTVYAFLVVVISLQSTIPVEGVSSLCEMADANVS